ncbi:hypothetical protein [Leucobacter sp. W1478]|uniref:hypothetical protein n=1 Tax=Leucobacter sp. W1478 TaxID=3439065 RepID=UPI003F3105D1
MNPKFKINALAATAAVAAMFLVGCSSKSVEEAPAAAPAETTVEETESSEAVVEEQAPQPEASAAGYQAIYDEYSARLTAECPTLAMTECAELSTEGVSKMAEYMLTASGTDGQYATYEEWAGKLTDVYMSVVQ